MQIIGERDFVGGDQERFAEISGDRNPMHMDAIVARRTLAGYPVVHGIHTLLWALDCVFRYLQDSITVASISVNFEKMIFVGDHVKAILQRHDGKRLRVGLDVDGITAMRFDLVLGDQQSQVSETFDGPLTQPTEPAILTYEEMRDCHGSIPLSSKSSFLHQMFPLAAQALGTKRLASLACCSYLVGMVCPGLHSIYRSLNLVTTLTNDSDSDLFHFRVVSDDLRFRLIRMAVSGGGWKGFIEAHARPKPTAQMDFSYIASNIVPGEFSGARALVVGGSRGLGELVSKIIAAGGGDVTLTYSVGDGDARRVQQEITDHGGRCRIMRFDVREDAQPQLAKIQVVPNQLYYMATPLIVQRRNAPFLPSRFQEFLLFYVTAFYDLSATLWSVAGTDISIFYPSSVFVDDRPANMTEYAMAKIAGEVLCRDMQSFGNPGRILVRRLPRLPTDQTAALFEMKLGNSVEIMVPIVREVHARQGDTANRA